MFNTVGRFLLAVTAIAPVLPVLAFMAVFDKEYCIFVILGLACLVLPVLCRVLIFHAKKTGERSDFRITSAEAADRENMNLMLLYLLPLFSSSFGTLNWLALVPSFIMVALIAATGHHYHFNPLLNVLGWHFYKVGIKEGVTHILLTRKQIRNVSESFKVIQLTEYIHMDIGD